MYEITNKATRNLRSDLVYPELSYQVVGALFEVGKNLGGGYREQYYQRALEEELTKMGVPFNKQVSCSLIYKGKKIGRGYIDLLVDGKIAVEIKKDRAFSKSNIDQLYSYLKATGLKLGILANFTRDGVKFRRIVNLR